MKQIFQKNPSFFIPYIVIWLALFGIVMTTTKLEQMTFINSLNSPLGDWFFYGATQLGEGWFWGATIIVFLFIRFDKSLIFTTSLILSTILSSSMKLFFDTLRPMAFFKGVKQNWHFVDGVTINIHQSFPSGHTTTAFAIFTLLMLFAKNKNWGYVCVTLAWLAGYSRCYLFQHFPEDVLGGATIGMLSSLIIYIWFSRRYLRNPKDWHERSLLHKGK
jgi:membrane-associated phospholipid phosphatase